MRIRSREMVQCTAELADWLRVCRDRVVAGEELKLDPFYARTSLLTEEVVTGVLTWLDGYIKSEIKDHQFYHAGLQGLIPTNSSADYPERESIAATMRAPAFLALPAVQQLAVVQGIDRVLHPHRMTPEDDAEEIAQAELAGQRAAEAATLRAANLLANPHHYDYENDWYD